VLLKFCLAESLSNQRRWNTADDAIRGNVFHDNASGRYHATLSDHHPRKHDRPVSNPHVVMHHGTKRVATGRVPNGLADHIETMVVAAYEGNSRRDQYVIADLDVTLNEAIPPKLDAVA
jgi:hypothetical protein